MSLQIRSFRRGLPRTPGGKPWPDVDLPAERSGGDGIDGPMPTASRPAGRSDNWPLRRGLPRVAGAEPWPQPGVAPHHAVATILVEEQPARPPAAVAPAQAAFSTQAEGDPAQRPSTFRASGGPLGETPVVPGAAPAANARRTTLPPWTNLAVLGALALAIVAALAVLGARWLMGMPAIQDFLEAYPGEYALPSSAPVGFPAWLAWQHFLNSFLLVLIIRSGLQVRAERRPAAYWASRRNPDRKISLRLWFHLSLDILWLVNGVLFFVLLFATGQWMRVVPTSLEVVPNALSAMLQYVSLNWPTENGWVNYNSLQQLAYFATIFLAAPLAALSGARLSEVWPTRWPALGRVFPLKVARAIHFPVMLYFVAFIVVHVGLVLTTGALRNLNHVYAVRDNSDLTGLLIFLLSILVTAAAWIAARPTTIASLAQLFGRVSSR